MLHPKTLVVLHLGADLPKVGRRYGGPRVARLDAAIKLLGAENAYFPCFVSQESKK